MAAFSTVRHDSVFAAHKHNKLEHHIVGCGAIGSRVFMGLVELGITRITAWDFDDVEPHNLANQAFRALDISTNKAEALLSLYRSKTGTPPPDEMGYVLGPMLAPAAVSLTGIVFLCVDSFDQRKKLGEAFGQNVFRVFDFRMGAMHGNVYAFTPAVTAERESWLATLGSDDPDAAELSPCGTPLSVGSTAQIAASLGVWQYMNWIDNPEGHDSVVNFYTRPMMVTTGALK